MIHSHSSLNETARGCCLRVAETHNGKKPSMFCAQKYDWAWPWLGFTAGLILLVPLVWETWLIVGPTTYAGGDGKSLQVQIEVFRKFASPFEFNILTPIQ